MSSAAKEEICDWLQEQVEDYASEESPCINAADGTIAGINDEAS